MKGLIVSAAILTALLIALSGWVVGTVEAAKPTPDPPPEPTVERFACFETQTFLRPICYDKTYKYIIVQFDERPNITTIWTTNDVSLGAQNVMATVAEVNAALSQ